MGKFRHRGTSRCYAGDVEAAPPYVNDFLATPDGLPGDAKLRLPADGSHMGCGLVVADRALRTARVERDVVP